MKIWTAAATGAGGIAATSVLWYFPPERYGFYPRCPIYEAFHIRCPGCGATRAAAALLHGHVTEALHWNALFIVGLFAVASYGLVAVWRGDCSWSNPPSWISASAVLITMFFGIARNIWL